MQDCPALFEHYLLLTLRVGCMLIGHGQEACVHSLMAATMAGVGGTGPLDTEVCHLLSC